MSISLKLLKKVRCRLLDQTTGQPLAGVVVSLSVAIGEEHKSYISLGTLRSDATGYLSFDLQPLIKQGLDTVSELLVSAAQVGLKDRNLFEMLSASRQSADGRLGRDLLLDRSRLTNPHESTFQCLEIPIHVAKLELDEDISACKAVNLPSIQAPDSCDYELSPYSFVMPAKISLGSDCCETLAPSTLPVQEHGFYRVLLRHDEAGDVRTGPIKWAVEVTGTLTAPEPAIKFADVLEYRQRWYALGHSLGEIKYSLPLAPGESTQLAVVEWARQDTASRIDAVKGTEYLQHELRRDRSIEESVEAGLKESQGGWSLMGGLSTGAAYDAGPYGKYTGNAALGGSVSNSWGERNVEADSLQDLHDKVTQATAHVRSLTSTVIVQATQAEQNMLQSRRVANHNHCHALTIQYYEVLRHFRLQTEFARRGKAVLIPFAPFQFNWERALSFRTILAQVLLDEKLLSCFDALVRLHLVSGIYDSNATTTPPVKKTPKSKQVDVIGIVREGSGSGVTVLKGDKFSFNAKGEITFSRTHPAWSKGPNGDADFAEDNSHFIAKGLRKYSLIYKIGQNGIWKQGGTYKSDTAATDGEIIFGVNDEENSFGDNYGWDHDKWEVELDYLEPEGDTTPKDPLLYGNEITFRKIDDQLCEAQLLTHLSSNQGYYNRAVWLLLDSTERRLYLAAALGNAVDILAAMDDRPIAVSGNYLAFPYNIPVAERDGSWNKVLESIVTLPTRGLFAEAQLGHCNSCEKRDATRMWDWTEMTAEEPPPISGIEPGPKGQMPSLMPAQLPSNVIQITQPPLAPDPTGLASAFGVLKTPDIFRDMSGLDNVSTLLGKLADGTISTLAGMIKAAGEAKDKVDAVRDANKATDKDTKGPSASDLADRFSLLPEIKSFAKDLGLDQDEYKDFALNQLYGTKPAQDPQPTVKPAPKPKTGQVQMQFQVVDAWGHFTDATFECVLKDDVIGDSGPLMGEFRVNPSATTEDGWLPAVRGLTKGVLNLRVRMLSESYEDLLSEMVDVQALDIPYTFPAGTNFARFTARQETDEVSVTVNTGETLGDKVGSSLSGTAGATAGIKIVELSLEGTYGKNWETELQKTQTSTREYKLKVPKESLDVKQVSPRP